MLSTKDILRIGSLAAVLLAGSCASPDGLVSEPMANHPIMVEPVYQSVKFPFAVSNAGLLPEDAARFNAFVSSYMDRGNGAISVSVPEGSYAAATISYFGERLADMGVPRDRMLVGTHEVINGDTRVELGYVGYGAHTDRCGDWSENLADTGANTPMPDFGCSVQHNVAAMVADPRDLIEPRGMGNSDVSRRTTVVGKYEQGAITQADKNKADKTNEQAGGSSEVH